MNGSATVQQESAPSLRIVIDGPLSSVAALRDYTGVEIVPASSGLTPCALLIVVDDAERSALTRARTFRQRSTAAVLILTPHSDPAYLDTLYALGQTDCLFEPVLPAALRAKADQFLQLARQQVALRHWQGEVERRLAVETAALLIEPPAPPYQRQVADILNSIRESFIAVDREWRFTFVNERVAQRLGRSASELLGQNLWQVAPEAAETAFWTYYHQVMELRIPVQFEAYYPTQHRWFEVHAYPTAEGLSAFYLDVTERRLAEEALRESEERQRLAVDAGGVGLWDWDIAGNHVVWSDRIYEFHGLQHGEYDGTVEAFAQLIHPDDRERVNSVLSKALTGGEPYQLEFRTVRPDGSIRWLTTSARVIRNEQGQPVRMVGATIDTTERRETEEALRRSNRELEEFAYVASHDLQEPLRTINIYTQLLTRHSAADDPQTQEFAGYVRGAVQRMDALIRDLLHFSRVVHGGSDPAHALEGSADLTEALQIAERALAAPIQETQAVIEAGPLPQVRGDAGQLTQLFQNLLSNALKYRRTDVPPCIKVSALARDGEWQISVADNGIGFEPQYAQRIFGLFKRLHRDEYPGTGVGLAICQRIVERHGGRIWAEGHPGGGATFTFTLQAAQ